MIASARLVWASLRRGQLQVDAVMLLVGAAALSGCQSAEICLARYTADPHVVVGITGTDGFLIHHVPSGRTAEFEGIVECEDSSGTQWVLRPTEAGQRWTLIQLRENGATDSRRLPAVPGVESPYQSFTKEDVALAFGPEEGEITAGVGKYRAGVDQITFLVWKVGQADWVAAKPPAKLQEVIASRLGSAPKARMELSRAALCAGDNTAYGFTCSGCGSAQSADILVGSRDDDKVVAACRLDAPDTKTYLTLSAKQGSYKRVSPPCHRVWMYSELKLTITDVASGKKRTIVERGLGWVLFDHLVYPVIDVISVPFIALTYTDA